MPSLKLGLEQKLEELLGYKYYHRIQTLLAGFLVSPGSLIEGILKDKSGVDKIIVKKQPYILLNTNRVFFLSFDASNFHKLDDESSYVRPNLVAILYFVRVCEGAIRRLAM